jgi:hypothetical protein
MDIAAALGCGGNGVECASLERSVVVFSNDKCGHDGFLMWQRVSASGIG